MSQSYTLITIPTDRSEYFIKVELSYNDGSLRKHAKGYWVSIRTIKTDGVMEMWSPFTPGTSKSVPIGDHPIARYSQKQFDNWAATLKEVLAKYPTKPSDYFAYNFLLDAIEEVKAQAGKVNM